MGCTLLQTVTGRGKGTLRPSGLRYRRCRAAASGKSKETARGY
jgi:hypothetical protein